MLKGCLQLRSIRLHLLNHHLLLALDQNLCWQHVGFVVVAGPAFHGVVGLLELVLGIFVIYLNHSIRLAFIRLLISLLIIGFLKLDVI